MENLEQNVAKEPNARAMRTLAIVLLLNAALSITMLVWQAATGQSSSTAGYAVAIIIDVLCAYYLFGLKTSILKLVLVRAILGLIVWTAISVIQGDSIGAVSQIVYSVIVIALCRGKFTDKIVLVLGLIAGLVIGFIGYQSINVLILNQRLVGQVAEIGSDSYKSDEYGFGIEVPGSWRIIQREDFDQIDAGLNETDAEIAAYRNDGQAVCLVIPETLDGLGTEYTVEELKSVFLRRISDEPDEELHQEENISAYANDGFRIVYSRILAGGKMLYQIVYVIHENVGVQFFVWTPSEKEAEIFNELEAIVDSLLWE